MLARWLQRVARVEADEVRPVAVAFLLFFCVLCGYFMLRPVRETIGTVLGESNGLTEVVLDTGGSMWSSDTLEGRVALSVYPWEVSLSRDVPADSAVNHLRAPISRITTLGNRARVAVGPLVAEVTTASVERLALREGEPVVASFKATAARLLPLA